MASTRVANASDAPKLPRWCISSSRTCGPAWMNGRRASRGSARARAVCRAWRAAGRSPAVTAIEVSSNQPSTTVCGSSAGAEPVQHRADQGRAHARDDPPRRRPRRASRPVLRCRRCARSASPGRCVPLRRARAAARRGTPASPSRRSVAGSSGCRRSPSVPVAAAASPSARSPRSNTAAPWTACSAKRTSGAAAVHRGRSCGQGVGGATFGVGGQVTQQVASRPSSPWRPATSANPPSRGRRRRPGPRRSSSASCAGHRRGRRRRPAVRGIASSGSRTRGGDSGSARHRTPRGRPPGRRARDGRRPDSGGPAPPVPAARAAGRCPRWRTRVGPVGSAPNCSTTCRSTARSTPPCAGQDCWAWRRSRCAAAGSPASRWVSAEASSSQGSAAAACAPTLRQRTPQRSVVPGQDQPDGEAVQQVGEQRLVVAVRGVLEGR